MKYSSDSDTKCSQQKNMPSKNHNNNNNNSYSNYPESIPDTLTLRNKAVECQKVFVSATSYEQQSQSIEEEQKNICNLEKVYTSNNTSTSLQESDQESISLENQEQSFSQNDNNKEQQEQGIVSPTISLKKITNESEYSDRILACMKENSYVAGEFLKNHTINVDTRAKMIDWMIEVTSSYACTDQTFFLSVTYMDQYFSKVTRSLVPSDLHLTGVVCMFIACKYEEVIPLHLDTFYEKIGHKRLSKEDIKRREQEILHVIDYDLSSPTISDFLTVTVSRLNLEDILESFHQQFFKEMSSYLSKLVCHDYKILSQFSNSTIAAAIIYVSLKILQQMGTTFDLAKIISQVISILNLNQQDLLKSSTTVLSLARNFEKNYPNLINLRKQSASIQQLSASQQSNKTNN